jgi:phosphatidylglycerol---prolipoprotein diacylglyceryl transferase
MSGYIHQPEIDPVLLHLWGPFQIRWYSLLYVGGFIVGRTILKRLAREDRFKFTADEMEQFILWLLIGAVVGARIIYCIFYDPRSLLADPLFIFKVYEGGLSFHGGLLGTMTAAFLFSRQRNIPFWNLNDAMALATPTGLAMGRLGNFINGELFGRVSYVPWAMIFTRGGPQPRHPSQLYEFFLEGVVLFGFLWWVKSKVKWDGLISVCFLLGYSLVRFIVEFFREPDPQLGYLTLGLSMGQWLSLATFLISSVVAYLLIAHHRAEDTPKKFKKKNR